MKRIESENIYWNPPQHITIATIIGYNVQCEIKKLKSIFLWITQIAATLEGDQEHTTSSNMVDINSIIEGSVKFRDGKKVNISAII